MLQYAADIIADMHIDLPTSEEAYRDEIDMRSRCGIYVILLRIFRHISVYITYTVAYFDILFEFRMFSEYHFSMGIYFR
jgi:hypothetical protein